MPSADPPSVVHSLAVSQVPKKHLSLTIGIVYQPIRVEDEAGVHGSLGNVTMEKSENWPENTMVTLNIYTLNIYTLLQGVVQFVTLNSSLGTTAYQHYSYCTRISGNQNLKRRLFQIYGLGISFMELKKIPQWSEWYQNGHI